MLRHLSDVHRFGRHRRGGDMVRHSQSRLTRAVAFLALVLLMVLVARTHSPVRRSVEISAAPDVWLANDVGTRGGMLARYGSPVSVSKSGSEVCWWYTAARLHTSADGRTF